VADINLGDAQNELAARGFDYLPTSRMTIMLNRALTDFGDYYNWPWLRKTASGTAPLTITDLKYVLKVFDQTGSELFGMSDFADVDVTQTGTPDSWWIDDTSGSPVMVAYPVGTVTFSIRYIAEAPLLSASTDTPLVPARYHPLWVDLAVIRAYLDSDNFAAASALRQDTEAALQRLVERYETRNRMNSQWIMVRAGSEDD
jgi:hypothetical protein